ncbi:hypothetical protein LNKW23_27290 [Paralimibaculum aggregatum]|uniref:DUF4345 domain-containing protein n=1 Tax=Paralimibaculum aggregatum TaxID=3036245 RepID=A0ABQ6LM45_9RHOB|nr:DUF4345 family protein [Limibaculum sp. NKW23]GMG83516.1 hypothetical protein LNKW23_27290 [Limibaculum sp. NKW23]
MRMPDLLAATLFLGGGIAVGIGGALLLAPQGFQATQGIALGADPALLSETRAGGGGLLAMGLLMLAGAFRPALAHGAGTVAAGVYLGYGLARCIGMALDGWPGDGLAMAAAAELAIGAAVLAALRLRTPAAAAMSRSPA